MIITSLNILTLDTFIFLLWISLMYLETIFCRHVLRSYLSDPSMWLSSFWLYTFGPFCLWNFIKLFHVHNNILLDFFLCYPNLLHDPLILFFPFPFRFPPHSTLLEYELSSNIFLSYTSILQGFSHCDPPKICLLASCICINWSQDIFMISSYPTILYLTASYNVSFVYPIHLHRPG